MSILEEAEQMEVFTPGEIKHIKCFLEDDALETPQKTLKHVKFNSYRP